MNCPLCTHQTNTDKHMSIPLHLHTDNQYHWICYQCYMQRDNNKCPFCNFQFKDFIIEIVPCTLIQLCILTDSAQAIYLLQNYKCDINELDQFNNSALIIACKNKLVDVALTLLQYKDCNFEQTNVFGQNASYFALKNNLIDILILL